MSITRSSFVGLKLVIPQSKNAFAGLLNPESESEQLGCEHA